MILCIDLVPKPCLRQGGHILPDQLPRLYIGHRRRLYIGHRRRLYIGIADGCISASPTALYRHRRGLYIGIADGVSIARV